MADTERNLFSASSLNWFDVSDLFTPSGRPRVIGRYSTRPHIWRPPTDVFEVDDHVVVRIEIAGMRENDFSITIKDKHLVVHGFRQDVPGKRAYHQMEILFGEFGSEVELPASVVFEQAKAEYRNGFLMILLPVEKPRHIEILSKEINVDQ